MERNQAGHGPASSAGSVLVAVAAALALAGCAGGSTELPGAGGPTSPTPGNPKLAFAQCMRAHGVPDFPDPGGSGAAGGGSVDPYDATFEAAFRTCHSLLPSGTESLQQLHQQMAETGLGFARCMRAHGIAGFPDPGADGQFPESQMRGLGKGSPRFSAAQDACQRYLSSPSQSGGKG